MAGDSPGDPGNVERMRRRKPVPAPDFAAADDAGGSDGRPPMLKQPCPATPLGVSGTRLIFLDRLQQLITASPREAEKGNLKLWFGNDWLETFYPMHDAKGNVTKFNQDHVQTALIEDCQAQGIFNPMGAVFGRGAHCPEGGPEQLVLHMGRSVMIANAPDKHGDRDGPPRVYRAGKVPGPDGNPAYYPAFEALEPPADQPASTIEASELLHMFGKWRWVDDRASPHLLLGFCGLMFICGAVEHRPHVWLSAPTDSGKTSLQKVIRALLGRWCLYTEDSSEAAIRQVLGNDTLPVLIDEAEAHDKPERLQAILNLMKKAYSGAKMYRGSQDHKATEFTAQSCFLLSSVLHAPLKGEDRNRMAILEMRGIPGTAQSIELRLPHWRALGRKLHRRMIAQWPRWQVTLDDYKAEIGKMGYSGRYRDTYGTLLACADLLLHDGGTRDRFEVADLSAEPEMFGAERVAHYVRIVRPAIDAGRSEARSDVDRVIRDLMSHMLPGAHGAFAEPIGAWIERAMNWKIVPADSYNPEMREIDHVARQRLSAIGMRLQWRDPERGVWTEPQPEQWDDAYLSIPYASCKPMLDVFARSEWAGGAWTQSFGKVPGAIKGRTVRTASGVDRAVLVPLNALRGEE